MDELDKLDKITKLFARAFIHVLKNADVVKFFKDYWLVGDGDKDFDVSIKKTLKRIALKCKGSSWDIMKSPFADEFKSIMNDATDVHLLTRIISENKDYFEDYEDKRVYNAYEKYRYDLKDLMYLVWIYYVLDFGYFQYSNTCFYEVFIDYIVACVVSASSKNSTLQEYVNICAVKIVDDGNSTDDDISSTDDDKTSTDDDDDYDNEIVDKTSTDEVVADKIVVADDMKTKLFLDIIKQLLTTDDAKSVYEATEGTHDTKVMKVLRSIAEQVLKKEIDILDCVKFPSVAPLLVASLQDPLCVFSYAQACMEFMGNLQDMYPYVNLGFYEDSKQCLLACFAIECHVDDGGDLAHEFALDYFKKYASSSSSEDA
jgi:hypothetical protein